MKKYTKTHEWITIDDASMATIGITEYILKELGEIVYVRLPPPNFSIEANHEVVTIETAKAAIDIYAPLSGTIIAINSNLQTKPSLINTSPEELGWLFKLKISNFSEIKSLISEEEYLALFESTNSS